MKLEISRLIFEKYSNINFHENPSSGSHAVPCELTDETKLLVAFRHFANMLKKKRRMEQNLTSPHSLIH
jgi:hypothetical protein